MAGFLNQARQTSHVRDLEKRAVRREPTVPSASTAD